MGKIVRFWAIFLGLCWLTACQQRQVQIVPPSNLIAEDTIVTMMAEQLLIEATLQFSPPDYDRNAAAKELYSQLFDKYDVTKEAFEKSVAYYFTNQEKMESLLARVQAQLTATESGDTN